MLGEIKLFCTSVGSIPRGWHICDGSRIRVGSKTVTLPKMGSISVTAHLEPEDDGTHEKVIAQAKTDGLLAASGVVYIICVDDVAGFTAAEEQRIRQIVQSELPSS